MKALTFAVTSIFVGEKNLVVQARCKGARQVSSRLNFCVWSARPLIAIRLREEGSSRLRLILQVVRKFASVLRQFDHHLLAAVLDGLAKQNKQKLKWRSDGMGTAARPMLPRITGYGRCIIEDLSNGDSP
jgi:hypothetical protein